MKNLLDVKNLIVTAEEKTILKGLNLSVNSGEIHVVLGPNGAGKSTLASSIMSNPEFVKKNGQIVFDGDDITNKLTNEVANAGIFLSFQTPVEIAGISVFEFLKTIKSKKENKNVSYFEFKKEVEELMDKLDINKELLNRDLNVGFSGGEKKKIEILQLLILNPKLAILDETDSGLDVDAVKIVSKGIQMFKTEGNAILIITHSAKILENLSVDKVHILVDGKIVQSGDSSLIQEVEQNGYSKFRSEANESK